MTYILHALIPTSWIVWLAYWIVATRTTNQTRRREGAVSRLSHYGPLILGGLLLGIPNILGPALDRPFHAATMLWLLLAIALVIPGLGFSALVRAYLGRNWSPEVTVKHHHELVRDGPYAVVRHPIYTGILLALIGTALMIGNWRVLIGLALVAAAILRKLTIKERFMAEHFGEDYARYRAEVPALIPFLV